MTVDKYFLNTLKYSSFRFIIEMTLLTFVFKAIIIAVLGSLLYVSTSNFVESDFHFKEYNFIRLAILGCIIAPLLETILFQWIPINILKRITSDILAIVLATALLFSLFHLSYDIPNSIGIFPLGLILAWSFFSKFKKSFSEAFLTTFAIHSFHNLIAIGTIAIWGIH